MEKIECWLRECLFPVFAIMAGHHHLHHLHRRYIPPNPLDHSHSQLDEFQNVLRKYASFERLVHIGGMYDLVAVLRIAVTNSENI